MFLYNETVHQSGVLERSQGRQGKGLGAHLEARDLLGDVLRKIELTKVDMRGRSHLKVSVAERMVTCILRLFLLLNWSIVLEMALERRNPEMSHMTHSMANGRRYQSVSEMC